VLKNNIKIYIKTVPTCFGAVTPSSRSALIHAYQSYNHENSPLKYIGVCSIQWWCGCIY